MARHGENIRKRCDGRWEGRYPIFSEQQKKTIYRSVYGKTYEETKRRLDFCRKRRRFSHNAGRDADGGEGTICLGDIIELWLEKIADDRKHSTYVKYSRIYKRYLASFAGKQDISDISEELIIGELPEDLSESVQKSIYCVINQALSYASRYYSLDVPDLKLKPVKTRRKQVEVLSRSEQIRLLDVLHHEMNRYKMAVLLCFYTGLRLGEVCALRGEDIDLENGLLIVRRTVQRIAVHGQSEKTVLMESEPKSCCSKREIPVSAVILELLVRMGYHRDYVFGEEGPMEPRTLQYHFKKYLKEAELTDKNFHILRHTFATNCIEGGTDVKTLSEILGHSDVQITMNRYVHPSMEVKRKSIDDLIQIYGQFNETEDLQSSRFPA